jgi:hypothetical protein
MSSRETVPLKCGITKFLLFQLTKDLANHKNEGHPQAESAKDKFSRKFAENPFIPIGRSFLSYTLHTACCVRSCVFIHLKPMLCHILRSVLVLVHAPKISFTVTAFAVAIITCFCFDLKFISWGKHFALLLFGLATGPFQ